MNKYSKNVKLNGVLNGIEEQLKELSLEEVKRYVEEFSGCIDYNIVEYGNLLVYYKDIQEFYKSYGYKTKFSDTKLWETYKRQVGYVVRQLLRSKNV